MALRSVLRLMGGLALCDIELYNPGKWILAGRHVSIARPRATGCTRAHAHPRTRLVTAGQAEVVIIVVIKQVIVDLSWSTIRCSLTWLQDCVQPGRLRAVIDYHARTGGRRDVPDRASRPR